MSEPVFPAEPCETIPLALPDICPICGKPTVKALKLSAGVLLVSGPICVLADLIIPTVTEGR